jgi:predicted P-loop ATPase
MGLTDDLSILLWRKWLIGCVARAMDPGCQLDTVLTLVAPKGGERKSSLFRSLVGNRWFSDTHLDMTGFKRQDSYMQLHRVWVYEVPELEGAKDRDDRARIKSFVSSRSDDFRAPYEATVRPHPRCVALGATTNSLDFMASDDPAFNRRFWPIRIKGKIDTEMVEELRDQIWTEALAAYQSGEPWHLDETQEASAAELVERQAELTDEDARLPVIRDYISVPARVDRSLRLYDIMRGALKFEPGKMPMADQKQVGSLMAQLGWKKDRRRWQPGEEKTWRWIGPRFDEGRAPLDEYVGAHEKP